MKTRLKFRVTASGRIVFTEEIRPDGTVKRLRHWCRSCRMIRLPGQWHICGVSKEPRRVPEEN